MDKTFIDQAEQRLLEEQKDLRERLGRISKKDAHVKGDYDAKFPQYTPADETESGDFDDSAHEVQDFTDNIGVENQLEVRLAQVDRALERLAKGRYGVCSKCKKEQPSERLQADPAAELCLDCQGKK
ncbi:MAG: TraR/DksA C4-type zinc finger protein [Parcubacteria group bacterium]